MFLQNAPYGVWPTMLTPFTKQNKVDYDSLAELVEWYINEGVDGLFAVCLSSEMYSLSLQERQEIASFVVKAADSRVPVVASGHVGEQYTTQLEEMKAMAKTGVSALVLTTNRFVSQHAPEEEFLQILQNFLRDFNSPIPLGFYECPVPHKRILSPNVIRFCADTGRFLFLKDTSCSAASIKNKIDASQNSKMRLYNANGATLLQSLQLGAHGYSGIQSNFFPGLICRLVNGWQTEPEKAEKIQNFLGAVAAAESRMYPVCAKYYLQLKGLGIGLTSRKQSAEEFNRQPSLALEMSQLLALEHEVLRNL